MSMFSLSAVSLAHLFPVSLCTKVLVIPCLCLDEFAVILKFELCFKIPFLYPVSLRIRLKSAKLAHRAPVFVPLIVRSGSPGCTQICHRLFRTISSSQNSAFVLYASCLCNMFLFFFLPKSPFSLPAPLLCSQFPLTFKLIQRYFLWMRITLDLLGWVLWPSFVLLQQVGKTLSDLLPSCVAFLLEEGKYFVSTSLRLTAPRGKILSAC